jgi:hypothetical protein
LTDERIERMRQREDQMKIRHRQERRFLFGQPLAGGLPLAERTMPIASGVRYKVSASTLLAAVTMTAQRRSATGQQRIDNAPMMLGQGWTRAVETDSQNRRQTQPRRRSWRAATGHANGPLGLR